MHVLLPARSLHKAQPEAGFLLVTVMTIKRILCPTDLTAGSDEALRYALALARAYEAKLVAYHCEPTNTVAEPVQSEIKESFEKSLFQYLGPAELALINWERVIERGNDPGAAISKFAADHSVDLIVMRSRRRPHRAALLGSTAESVCRSAPCPVLVMHNDEQELVGGLARVLVAYDFSDYSELALKYGLSIAQEHQAELHLLHVLPPRSVSEPEIAWYPIKGESAYHTAAQRMQRVGRS